MKEGKCVIVVVDVYEFDTGSEAVNDLKMTDRTVRLEQLDAFHKILMKFTKVDDLTYLASRLFQKLPSVCHVDERYVNSFKTLFFSFQTENDVQKILDENYAADRAGELRLYIANMVREATRPNSELQPMLPRHLEKYSAFCDIHFKFLHMDTIKWHTFVLLDYQPAIHDLDQEKPVHIEDIQKKILKRLNKSENFGFVSVQFEIDVKQRLEKEMLVLRIATVAPYKRLDKDQLETKAMRASPTFYAYFPGEPYFYASSLDPSKHQCQAIVQTLKCTGYSPVPLSGNSLESLRQLRLSRHNQNAKEPEFKVPLPNLQTFEVSFQNKIDALPLQHPDTTVMTNNDFSDDFSCTLTFKGTDVLKGFDNACKKGFIEKPFPNWIINAPIRGRNVVSTTRKKPSDEASVAPSDLTAING